MLAGLFGWLLFAGGCASAPVARESADTIATGDSVPADRHRLIIYRTSEHALYLGRAIPLRLDGKNLRPLRRGEAIYCDVTPGPHVLESETFDYAGRFRLEFTPQEPVVFVEALPRNQSYWAGFLSALAPTPGLEITTLIATGMTEARVSGQGGLFALLARPRAEAARHLHLLKAMPVSMDGPTGQAEATP